MIIYHSFIFLRFRFISKNRSSYESFNEEEAFEDSSESEDDERPDSLDEKTQQREKRKGFDLATTLERIEKNFVITDPRLPDNPIVRLYYHLRCTKNVALLFGIRALELKKM